MAFGDVKLAASDNGTTVVVSNFLGFDPNPTVAVGDLVYVVFIESTSITVSGVTDNRGNTYTALNAGTDAGVVTGRAFYSRVTNAGTLTGVTFAAVASSNDIVMLGAVFEGPFTALDQNPANITSDVSSPFNCPATGVLTQADELVVAWGAANYLVVWAATSPMVEAIEQAVAFPLKGILASKVVAATTTTTPVFTAASNPTQAILATTTFRKKVTETVTVTQATVTLTGKTVTVLNIETVPVTQATVTAAGKTVTVRELDLITVAKAAVIAAGQVVTPTDFFVERITVDPAAVLFTGQTVDLVEIVGGALDLDFINDPSIASRVTCVRAGTANMDDAAGNWSSVAANTLRLSDKGLLVESARTNSLRNNSMQGASAPTTAPTNWALATLGGLTRTIVGIGTESGVDYIDIKYSGTTTGALAGSQWCRFETLTQIAASSGQTWTASVFAYLVGGSLANISLALGVVEATSGGVELAKSTAAITPTSGPLGRQRAFVSRTLNQATIARIYSQLEISYSTGVAVDFTLRIGWPQLESSSTPTSPIRTTTVAVARAADVVTVNSPPTINAVAGGMFAEYVVPYDAFVAGTNYIFQIDDGTTSNRVVLFEQTSLDQNTCFVTAGGATQVPSLGHGNVYPYGTIARSAVRYAADDVAFSNDGLGPVFDTVVTLPTGLNRFGIGSAGTGTVNTFAYIRHLKYFDDPLTDAELVELTSSPTEIVGVDHGFLDLIGQPVTPTDALAVTNAAIAFAGQTVTIRETSSIVVTAGAVTITGKTVTIRDTAVIAVGHALLAFTGKPITIVSAIPVTRATVTFAGKTITIVNSTFQDIPKYIIRGRGSRHDIKGRGSRVFLVTR